MSSCQPAAFAQVSGMTSVMSGVVSHVSPTRADPGALTRHDITDVMPLTSQNRPG